eukprot:TRINITY_DN4796_c0_g1_i1.p1 TRINITY_DN4796_c0_g1~~TRINITY_DN4796_c0_g1_i1.p1  ORF type:complete len:185 (-),score=54.86 TRINITY_DN4796_c0_g1_i1:52-606(-)
MGLLTIIKKVKQQEKEIRILMLGLDNAGKTTIVKKFNGEDTSTISPTLGFNIQTLEYDGYKLNVWDIGGQKSIRSYWRNYYEQTDGLIWVVDSTDRRRMEECGVALHELLKEEKLAGATLLVFANKQDIESAADEKEVAEVLKLDQIGSRHWSIHRCSAVSGEGLSGGVDWVVKDIASRVFMLE